MQAEIAASKARRSDAAGQPRTAEAPTWTIRYTAHLDNGLAVKWEREENFVSADRSKAAGNILLALKTGMYGICVDSVFYPPQRIEKITWEVD